MILEPQSMAASVAETKPGLEPSPLLQSILDTHQPSPRSIDGLVIGLLSGLSPEGVPELTLSLPGFPERLTARSLCPTGLERVGTSCAVLFEQGNPEKPIIVGFLHQPQALLETNLQAPKSETQGLPAAAVDGERVVIEAKREIVFQCGKASITLTRAGKVLIRGTYVLSRSSGANRIKGGSVLLN